MTLDPPADVLALLPLIAVGAGRTSYVGSAALVGEDAPDWGGLFAHQAEVAPVDTMAALCTCVRRGLTPALRSLLAGWGCSEFLDEPCRRVLAEIDDLYRELASEQRRLGELARSQLSDCGVRSVLMKSYDVHDRFATQPWQLLSYDVDLLIEARDFDVGRARLAEIGFVQGHVVHGKVVPIAHELRNSFERGHYEWWPFVQAGPVKDLDALGRVLAEVAWPFAPGELCDGRVRTAVAVDLHHGIDTTIPAGEAWKSALTAPSGGLVLSATFLTWFVSCRFYTEIVVHGNQRFRALNQLVDLLCGADVDWVEVKRLCSTYSTHVAVAETLSVVRALYGVGPTPDWLIDVWRKREQRSASALSPLLPALLRRCY